MRQLAQPPSSLAVPGDLPFGSFRGDLPRLDLPPTGRGRLWDLLHQKRWTYAAFSNDEVFVGAAVVWLGYVSTALAFVFDRRESRMLADRSTLGPPGAVSLSDEGGGARGARFGFQKVRIELSDAGMTIDLPATSHERPAHVSGRFEAARAPAISAFVPIDGGLASATEKRVTTASGEIVAEGRRFLVEDGFAALDHTAGFLARHTVWRWALGIGRATSGERIGFNVVEGFVGEPECAAWIGDEVFPLGEARFDFDRWRPAMSWQISTTCGGLDVRFHPGAVHAEHKNLGVARSEFIQPVGSFEGRLRVGGREISFTRLAGVTEHQDVVW